MDFPIYLIEMAVQAYILVIILQVAISWLVVFKVFNLDNPQARNLVNLLQKVTDPVMRPVQRYVPPIGGLDLTPIVVIVGLEILQSALVHVLMMI